MRTIHLPISLDKTLAVYDRSVKNSDIPHTQPNIVKLEDGGVCGDDGGDVEGS